MLIQENLPPRTRLLWLTRFEWKIIINLTDLCAHNCPCWGGLGVACVGAGAPPWTGSVCRGGEALEGSVSRGGSYSPSILGQFLIFASAKYDPGLCLMSFS